MAASESADVDAIKAACTGMFANLNLTPTERVKYGTDDMVMIRPTGNPLSMPMYDAMLASDDVVVEKQEVLKFNYVDVCGEAGFCCFTQAAKFTFKGSAEDDVAVFTAYLKKKPEGWRIVYAQRSTGRKPTEDMPNFDI